MNENDHGDSGTVLSFKKRLGSSYWLGTIISCTLDDNESTYRGPYEVVGKFHKNDLIAQWSAIEAAEVKAMEHVKAFMKKPKSHITETVKEWRMFLTRAERRALALNIFELLTKD